MMTCLRTCPYAWMTAWPGVYVCVRGQLEKRCRIGCVVTPKKAFAATNTPRSPFVTDPRDAGLGWSAARTCGKW